MSAPFRLQTCTPSRGAAVLPHGHLLHEDPPTCPRSANAPASHLASSCTCPAHQPQLALPSRTVQAPTHHLELPACMRVYRQHELHPTANQAAQLTEITLLHLYATRLSSCSLEPLHYLVAQLPASHPRGSRKSTTACSRPSCTPTLAYKWPKEGWLPGVRGGSKRRETKAVEKRERKLAGFAILWLRF